MKEVAKELLGLGGDFHLGQSVETNLRGIAPPDSILRDA